MQVHRPSVAALLLLLTTTATGGGQAPVRSLGQPARWEPYVYPAVIHTRQSWRGALSAGVHRPVTSPVGGLLGFAGEAYGVVDDEVQPGARLFATTRALGIAAGVSWSARTHAFDPTFSHQSAIRRGAIAALVRQPGWDDVLARAMEVQSQRTAKFADQVEWTTPDVDSSATCRADTMLRGFEQALSESERKAVSFYFSLGSQNMDPRGLMLDGEASIIVSGLHAAAGLVDLYYLMARSTWIESKPELDRLVPTPRGLMARFARSIRNAL